MDTTSIAPLSYENRINNGAISGARASRCLVVGTLLFAVCNFVLVFLICLSNRGGTAMLLIPAFYGLIGAQGAIHAIWSVLAPVRHTIRLAVGAVAGLFLFGACMSGFALFAGRGGVPNEPWADIAVPILLCLPLMAIATQSPLWVAKVWFRWRITLSSDCSWAQCDPPLGIRDLLVATAAVAVALSAARFAAPSSISPAAFLSSVAIAALTVAAMSAFTTIPAAIAILLPRRLRLAMVALLFFDLAITIVGIGMFVWLAPEGPYLRWQEYVGLATMALTFFACLSGVMLLVRRLGARVIWGIADGRHVPETGRNRDPVVDATLSHTVTVPNPRNDEFRS